jgi:O-antigen/teichoic acid export membrane protein
MRLAKESILYFVSDVGSSIVGFAGTLYFARVLGSEPLGKYFAVIGLIAWATIPTNGISAAITKRVSEGSDANEIFCAGTIMNGVYGGILFLTLVIGESYVNSYIGADVSLYFGALLLSNILLTSITMGLKGKKMVATAGFLDTFERAMRMFSQVLLIYFGYNFFGLITGHFVSLTIASLIGIVIYRLRLRVPTKEDFEKLYSYAKFSWLGSLKGKTFGWMDIIVLQLFVSSGLVGVYGVSWRLASVLVLLNNAIGATVFPEVSEISADGNKERVSELLNETLFFSTMFVVPGFFGVLTLGNRILRIYGPEFVEGMYILLILIFARLINVYGSQMLNIINGIDRPEVAFRINLVFVVTNVTLNFVLIYFFGWYGAAVATTVSSLVTFALSYRLVGRLLEKPKLPFLGILKQVAAAGAMSGSLFLIEYALPFWNTYVTVGAVFFGAFVYSVSLYALSERVREKTHSVAPV